jgi:hypothetical protein
MYGGFAFALMQPEVRKGELDIYQSQSDKREVCQRFAAQSGFVRRNGSR